MAKITKSAAVTKAANNGGIKPTSAWEYLKKENYELSSIKIVELEHDCIRIHKVTFYPGQNDGEFAVMEVSYIINDEESKSLSTERFELRTGAARFLKLGHDINAAKESGVQIGSVPIRISAKGQAYLFEPVEDNNPPLEPETQAEIPF